MQSAHNFTSPEEHLVDALNALHKNRFKNEAYENFFKTIMDLNYEIIPYAIISRFVYTTDFGEEGFYFFQTLKDSFNNKFNDKYGAHIKNKKLKINKVIQHI